MSEHPIKSLMTTAMENLKDMIDVNTIIGDPVETPDGSVILTVSKVGFGFAAGGSEFHGGGSSGPEKHDGGGGNQQNQGHKLPFGGGSGGGVSITPIAFLIVNSHGVKMLHLDESTSIYERLLDLAPQAVEKVQHMLNNNKQNKGSQSSQSYNDHKQDLDF
ncbi:GerW family sporulation protein [Sutcliffiella horikoshii]|uniref:GerW family sporulation protein n=1 Tax=Sutcliffiella horikoshii TaxID=79883 RepID=UPI001EEDF1AB|nr:GerW family sporulation protein [Sutcliffiella horikoshii]MCG1022047.1 sporulation protein YtfJ [Sutcliffiella horikoshii]